MPDKSPAVSPSISLPICVKKPEDMFLGSPIIPSESLTVSLSASDPVRVEILDASMIPDV